MEIQLVKIFATETSRKGSILGEIENRADKILIRQNEDTQQNMNH